MNGVSQRAHFSRRAFLGVTLSASAAALIAACSAPATPAAAPTAAPKAAEAPKPTEAPKAAEAPKPTEAPKAAEAAKPAASGKQVTIRYGTFWPQYRLDIMAGPVKVFQEKNASIKVELEGSGAQYRDKLATQMAGGTAADAGICDVWAQMRYVDQGLAADATDFLKREGVDIQKDSWLMGYEVLGGKVFAFPWVLSPHRWYFNKTLLKQAGAKDPWDDLKGEWTWADFKDMLTKVNALPKKDGKVKIYGAKLTMNTLEYQLGGFIYSNGGSNYTLEPYKYTLDDPKLIEAAEFVIEDLHLKNKLILPPDEAQSLTQGGVTDPFASGVAAFQEDSTGRLTVTRDTVKDAFQWDVVGMPKPKADSSPRAAFAADANFVYNKGQNKDEAMQVLKFFSGFGLPDMQVTLSKEKLLLPSNKKAARENFATPPPAHVSSFITGEFVGHFLHYKGNECNRLIEAGLDKAILGQQPVKKTLLDLNTELNKLVDPPKNKQLDTFKYNFGT